MGAIKPLKQNENVLNSYFLPFFVFHRRSWEKFFFKLKTFNTFNTFKISELFSKFILCDHALINSQ